MSSDLRRLAVIPARGGSKRVPRKNVLPFLGRPIISYTIEAAIESAMFKRVIVSTDDREIAAVGREFGAEISERPAELSGDTARLIHVCLHELDKAEAEDGPYDVIGCLLAPAPMRTASDVRAVTSSIDPGTVDFAVAVTCYGLPPHQALKLADDSTMEPMWPDLINERADSIPTLVVDNGSTYAMAVGAFRREQSFFGPRLKGHVMDRARSIDIDEPFDFELAEYYANQSGQ